MPQKSLNDCAEPQLNPVKNLDPSKPFCPPDDIQFQTCDGTESLFYQDKVVAGIDGDSRRPTGMGEAIFCDPMTTGRITQDPHAPPLPPDISVIYGNAQGIRGTHEAVKKLFQNIEVSDSEGKIKPVTVVWGPQEKAVAVATQINVRKDNTGVVDRIILPIMSLTPTTWNFAPERYLYHGIINYQRLNTRFQDDQGNAVGSLPGPPGWVMQERQHPRDTVLGVARGVPVNFGYTLTAWAKYWEDMNQILQQISTKIYPFAYIRVQGITNWETTVKIDSVASNINSEPGEKDVAIYKYQISLTAESFIPYPIARRKSVLKTKVEVVDGIDEADIQSVIMRLEAAVGDIGK